MPAEVRVLLVAEETTELKELATRADQLWLKFGQRRGDHVAAVQAKEEQQKGLRKINRTDGIRQEQHDRRDHTRSAEHSGFDRIN
jgi:hypothetical protein